MVRNHTIDELPGENISDEEESEDDPDEETTECIICYDEHPVSKTFSLSWGHTFGIRWLRRMFKVNINDGKIHDLKWAHYECDK